MFIGTQHTKGPYVNLCTRPLRMQCIDLLMWHAIRGSSVAALKSDEALLDLWRCLPEVLRNGRRAVLPQSAVGSPGMPRVRLRSHPDGWQLTESTSSLWDLSEFAQSTVDTFFGERERERVPWLTVQSSTNVGPQSSLLEATTRQSTHMCESSHTTYRWQAQLMPPAYYQ